MPRKNRIVRNYYLREKSGRGSLWSLWLSPVAAGYNDIYFAGSGYHRANGNRHGFVFHLSHHKDGRSHIKYEGDKIHKFQLQDQDNFPVCSVYAHSDDLLVPARIPNSVIGKSLAIDLSKYSNPNSFKWCELFFCHLEQSKAQAFVKKYTGNQYDFNVIELIDIGQGRVILVLFRFIETTAISGAMPDISRAAKLDYTNRLTIWGLRPDDETYVTVHDLAATNPARIKALYRKFTLRRVWATSVSPLALLS